MNLEAYFDRIALPDPTRRSTGAELDFLRQLIRLHSQSISFENLNTLMRLPVPLDLAALEAKLVASPRGGFCFEQNGLFAAVLEEIGYRVRRLAARVVWGRSDGAAAENPRTHMVMLVSIGRQEFLCDVGFGGITPTAPLALVSDAEQATPHEPFRLRALEQMWLLQVAIGGGWRDVYLFDLQRQEAADYEMANHYVCTHPASHFRHTLIAARPFEGGRYALRNYVLTTHTTGGSSEERTLSGAKALCAVLEDRFGVVVPDYGRFADALENNLREAGALG